MGNDCRTSRCCMQSRKSVMHWRWIDEEAFKTLCGGTDTWSVHIKNMLPVLLSMWTMGGKRIGDGQKDKGAAALYTTRLYASSQSGQKWRYEYRHQLSCLKVTLQFVRWVTKISLSTTPPSVLNANERRFTLVNRWWQLPSHTLSVKIEGLLAALRH